MKILGRYIFTLHIYAGAPTSKEQRSCTLFDSVNFALISIMNLEVSPCTATFFDFFIIKFRGLFIV